VNSILLILATVRWCVSCVHAPMLLAEDAMRCIWWLFLWIRSLKDTIFHLLKSLRFAFPFLLGCLQSIGNALSILSRSSKSFQTLCGLCPRWFQIGNPRSRDTYIGCDSKDQYHQ
jgi:hypothetical protein